MLSQQDNENLTRVGPGTPMGDVLRRYWTPALLCSELPEPGGDPVRVRLLSENLVAFRDLNGRVGLIQENCPHRGASLYYGRNEGTVGAPRTPGAGRVRLASFSSVIGSLIPRAVAALTTKHPGLQIGLTDTQPPEALELLRTGRIDIAIIFRYDDTEPEPADVRLHHLLDDPLYVLSTRPGQTLSALRDATWIAGCDRCRIHLLSMCAEEGFEPRIGYTSDDMVVMQALVAAGLGVTTSPGLALRAHLAQGIVASELPESRQHIYAATYGEPPDPPATTALLAALAEAAASIGGVSSTSRST